MYWAEAGAISMCVCVVCVWRVDGRGEGGGGGGVKCVMSQEAAASDHLCLTFALPGIHVGLGIAAR